LNQISDSWGASAEARHICWLPACRTHLNWVRIAARFPIRVLLDTPPGDLMRFRATAVIVIEE
jgi:multidrug efflux system membrane fusion protein